MIKKGYLIYERSHYEKNKWFANKVINDGYKYELDIKLIFTDDKCDFNNIDFVINRSHDFKLSDKIEKLNIKVYNDALVAKLGNDKKFMYEYYSDLPMMEILAYDKLDDISYPLIVKGQYGYGGNQVHFISNKAELANLLNVIDYPYIIQKYSKNANVDIRVYIINNKIIKAIKRESNEGFKANISSGGQASVYELIDTEILDEILKRNKFDFVGIDFIYDNNKKLVFNEIEDVVGTRSIYELTDIDIIDLFLRHLSSDLIKL